MAPPIPTREPVSFIAGDTLQWTKSLADYAPTDGWTLKYRFVGSPAINSGNAYTASVSSGIYSITIPAADTAAATSDSLYRLIGWVEKGSAPVERHTILDTTLTAFANAATATATQLQSAAEATLAIIDAAINSRLTSDGIESYTVDGRVTNLMTMAELQAMRSAYAVRVARERGLTHPRHGVRFHVPR